MALAFLCPLPETTSPPRTPPPTQGYGLFVLTTRLFLVCWLSSLERHFLDSAHVSSAPPSSLAKKPVGLDTFQRNREGDASSSCVICSSRGRAPAITTIMSPGLGISRAACGGLGTKQTTECILPAGCLYITYYIKTREESRNYDKSYHLYGRLENRFKEMMWFILVSKVRGHTTQDNSKVCASVTVTF